MCIVFSLKFSVLQLYSVNNKLFLHQVQLLCSEHHQVSPVAILLDIMEKLVMERIAFLGNNLIKWKFAGLFWTLCRNNCVVLVGN